jgi:hypothetical protein
MKEKEPSTHRPFVFTVIEDDGVNVTIEDYLADLAAGIDEEETMKPGRHKLKRGASSSAILNYEPVPGREHENDESTFLLTQCIGKPITP